MTLLRVGREGGLDSVPWSTRQTSVDEEVPGSGRVDVGGGPDGIRPRRPSRLRTRTVVARARWCADTPGGPSRAPTTPSSATRTRARPGPPVGITSRATDPSSSCRLVVRHREAGDGGVKWGRVVRGPEVCGYFQKVRAPRSETAVGIPVGSWCLNTAYGGSGVLTYSTRSGRAWNDRWWWTVFGKWKS